MQVLWEKLREHCQLKVLAVFSFEILVVFMLQGCAWGWTMSAFR